MTDSTNTRLSRWHATLAGVAGEMSLALVRRAVRRGAPQEWRRVLERTCREMVTAEREEKS